ncbi:MAG: hypothetical protein QW674_03650 [Candidatus Bathyarchaeia archaeon]
MPLFHFRHHEDKLKCPYKGCEKTFEKPTIITDSSTFPRQSYYACPHCMSKLEITVKNMKIVDVKPAEYPKVFDSPAKCAHFSSLLNAQLHDGMLPDECLLCPKVLQCRSRK